MKAQHHSIIRVVRKEIIEMEKDMVNNPQHYTAGNIEVIDYIQDNLTDEMFEGFCIGNVIKYVSRYRLKNGTEDLAKAEWYLKKVLDKRKEM